MARDRTPTDRPRGSDRRLAAVGLAVAAGLVALGVWRALPSSPPPAPPRPASPPRPDAPADPAPRPGRPAVERLVPRVVRALPHDPQAFTQGLLFHDGYLYESTGLRGRSELRRVRPDDGVVDARVALDPALFGEGLARVGDRLVQLTWQSGRALVWDLARLEPLERFSYRGEGWGLCHDGERLVMSDGSDRLTFRATDDFRLLGSVRVTLEGQPLFRLNELECVDGAVWANVWTKDDIVRIDPRSGAVTAVVDASGLRRGPGRARGDDVLNGIAAVPGSDRFFLTGKLWDRVFEVELVPADGAGDAAPAPTP